MKNGIKNCFKTILFGLLFMIISLVSIYIFGQVTHLTCNKDQNNAVQCEAEKKLIDIVSLSKRKFSNVTNAAVESSCDDDGCSYRVLLMTSEGQEPLTVYYSSGESAKQNMADQINVYAKSTGISEELTMQDNSGLWASLMSFAFMLVGLYLIIVRGIFAPAQELAE